jgi:predicted transcriptional regulator YdeE
MEVVEKPPLFVVGIKVVAAWDYLFTEVPHAWEIFFEKYQNISNRIDNKFMDISINKKDNIYTQLLCVQVQEIDFVPDGMIGMNFPAQKYLVNNFKGQFSSIPASFEKMYNWIENNGYTSDDFKIDYGYFPNETDPIEHKLHIRVY